MGTATINLKVRPQATSEPLGGISNGKEFEIEGEVRVFYRIEMTNGTGYLSAKYVKVGEPKSENGSGQGIDFKDWLVLA